jgi:hypothetical protein
MKESLKLYIGVVVIFAGMIGLIRYVVSKANEKYDNATFRIESGNDKIYYANTFRMYGKGITFDSVDGKKVILTGDIDIEYINKEK